MAGRGQQTFSKRLKEQQRKEKQQEKFARRQQRKLEKLAPGEAPASDDMLGPFDRDPNDPAPESSAPAGADPEHNPGN